MAEIKGWHVFSAFVVFFGAILASNVALVYLAISTFRGIEDPKPYLRGLEYNQALAERERQRALGWHSTIDLQSGGEGYRLSVAMATLEGKAIPGLSFEAELRRPATKLEDRPVDLFATGKTGLFVADLGPLAPGAWDFVATANDSAGNRFDIRNRLMIE
ncbi:MAG: FixH family protein [Pseudomonadota bacterium]